MADLNGHEAGNGGYSQRKPTAHRDSSTRKLVRNASYNTISASATFPCSDTLDSIVEDTSYLKTTMCSNAL